jgi:hypothetical protein
MAFEYRFYVSSALLRGRRAETGSVGRVPAAEIERAVLAALQSHQGQEHSDNGPDHIGMLKRVVITRDQLVIVFADTAEGDGVAKEVRIAWSTRAKDAATAAERKAVPEGAHDESLIQSIVRSHAWMRCLRNGAYHSIEQLAEANRLHPKVVRQALRLAFLSPEVTGSILEGQWTGGFSLANIPKRLSVSWKEQQTWLTLNSGGSATSRRRE